jgi:hypothetical protein
MTLTTTAVRALVCFIMPRVGLLVRCLYWEDTRDRGSGGLGTREGEVVGRDPKMRLTRLGRPVVGLSFRHTEGWGG